VAIVLTAQETLFESPLDTIRSLVRSERWLLAVHVQEDLEVGAYEVCDLERSICTGTITKIERDELCEAIDRKKYVISGVDQYGLAFETCGKIVDWIEGHTYFFITAYKER
jgi:hypothetical protein